VASCAPITGVVLLVFPSISVGIWDDKSIPRIQAFVKRKFVFEINEGFTLYEVSPPAKFERKLEEVNDEPLKINGAVELEGL